MIRFSSTSTSALDSGGQSSKVRATYCFSLSGKVVFCAGCDGTEACICGCVVYARLKSASILFSFVVRRLVRVGEANSPAQIRNPGVERKKGSSVHSLG